MVDMHETIVSGLAERYAALGKQVQNLAAPLSNQQFWQKPFPYGNSFGHLVLHLTGNLNYYIGAEIGGIGYVRDRNREFTEKERPSKTEVLKRFEEALALVITTIQEQSEEDWAKSYTALREDDAKNRFNILLRCATHLHHHIGQMTYLSFALKASGS